MDSSINLSPRPHTPNPIVQSPTFLLNNAIIFIQDLLDRKSFRLNYDEKMVIRCHCPYLISRVNNTTHGILLNRDYRPIGLQDLDAFEITNDDNVSLYPSHCFRYPSRTLPDFVENHHFEPRQYLYLPERMPMDGRKEAKEYLARLETLYRHCYSRQGRIQP